QFYLAYTFQYHWFLNFIPMVGLTLIPIVLILSGYSGNIGRSITFIPGVLMLTAYSFSHMVLIYGLDIEGYAIGAGGILLFLILITELNDIFQYNWGKAFGKHVILPRISPNKTWEGFLGGVFTTTLVAGIFHFLTPLSFIQSMIAGLLLSVFGFFGDALLSAIKRDLKVKDTDDLIPGHGGVMDRMDSLVFNAPVFFYLITLFTNQNL
ncbi:MAG: CDP-archaeol synthase, partial [Crocinitomicaceae bacterium]